jgi:DNA transposition AAA+ family ATPase
VLVATEQKRVEDVPFIVTRQVKEMAAACHALIETRDMGVIFGDPGVGKTLTAEHITAKWSLRGYPKAIYVEADVGSTPAGVARNILKGLADLRPANSADMARIIANLTQDQELELMIVDEAERFNRHCLEMIRSIYDRSKVPVMLIGMANIVRNLKSHKKFYSRIGIAYYFEPLSYEQLAKYLERLHPLLKDIDPVTEKRLLDFIYRATKGEFRRINRLVKQAERVRKANNHPVLSMSVFEAASKLLLNVD